MRFMSHTSVAATATEIQVAIRRRPKANVSMAGVSRSSVGKRGAALVMVAGGGDDHCVVNC
jgi:hypothetical protein